MIDIHCHILPKLDDGASSLEKSLAMCRIAFQDGIKTIVASPHIREGFFSTTPEIIKEKVQELKTALAEAEIEMEILPGADVRVAPEMITDPGSLKGFTINQAGKYFLLEFADELLPPNPKRLIDALIGAGIIPIITHPERNFILVREPQILWDLAMAGALVQVTASSLTGRQGPMVTRYSRLLLEHHMVQFLATDAHSVDNRPPLLGEGVRAAVEIVGEEEATALVERNPRLVIEGKDLDRPLPQPFKPPQGMMPPRRGEGWLSRLFRR